LLKQHLIEKENQAKDHQFNMKQVLKQLQVEGKIKKKDIEDKQKQESKDFAQTMKDKSKLQKAQLKSERLPPAQKKLREKDYSDGLQIENHLFYQGQQVRKLNEDQLMQIEAMEKQLDRQKGQMNESLAVKFEHLKRENQCKEDTLLLIQELQRELQGQQHQQELTQLQLRQQMKQDLLVELLQMQAEGQRKQIASEIKQRTKVYKKTIKE